VGCGCFLHRRKPDGRRLTSQFPIRCGRPPKNPGNDGVHQGEGSELDDLKTKRTDSHADEHARLGKAVVGGAKDIDGSATWSCWIGLDGNLKADRLSDS